MRKIVAGFAVSLDGYIEGPTGGYDWIRVDPSFDFTAEMAKYDTFLYGRKSYEKIIAMRADLSQWQNFVFSRTLTEVGPSFTLIKDQVEQTVIHLKNQKGKDIALYGGAHLFATLLDYGLVDEVAMTVIPVLLGGGKPMVGNLKNKVLLEPVETVRYRNGNIQLKYKVGKG